MGVLCVNEGEQASNDVATVFDRPDNIYAVVVCFLRCPGRLILGSGASSMSGGSSSSPMSGIATTFVVS